MEFYGFHIYICTINICRGIDCCMLVVVFIAMKSDNFIKCFFCSYWNLCFSGNYLYNELHFLYSFTFIPVLLCFYHLILCFLFCPFCSYFLALSQWSYCSSVCCFVSYVGLFLTMLFWTFFKNRILFRIHYFFSAPFILYSKDYV